jgi:endonuclease G
MQVSSSSPLPFHANVNAAPGNAPAPPSDGSVAKLDDLFDGSKPKFGPAYSKFIAATQVPHSIDPKVYYDAAADSAHQQVYYAGVANLPPAQLTAGLRSLVTETHHPDPRGYDYVIAKSLYADVDRQPDGTVRNVYGPEPIKVLQYPDVSFKDLSEKDVQTLAAGATLAPEVLGAWLGFQKSSATLNCEHVVPQHYFNKEEPMRSDLHHLYAADIAENSGRGDTPYGQFVPEGGKGEVARATLYFMLRYPDVKLPYTDQDVTMFKNWSDNDPPTLHELHRNAEVEKLQGNRNPFTDHPEWVKDFQK